ncbi:unknown [Staphylococcus sp. CAG:324]|jgi:hypothetical protein|nr:hypothetical protein [Staphylococcus sp.]CDC71379.1 unknown [Staphylococcus sp. CAG:324]
MDSQLDADKVWRIPLIIAEELGGKEFYRFLEKDEELLKESYKIFLSLYPYLKTKEYITTLFGTYDNWNQKRSMWYQGRSINDYIITLIQCGYYELANKCYEIIGKEEFKSTYFIKHIDFMKQKIKNK